MQLHEFHGHQTVNSPKVVGKEDRDNTRSEMDVMELEIVHGFMEVWLCLNKEKDGEVTQERKKEHG